MSADGSHSRNEGERRPTPPVPVADQDVIPPGAPTLIPTRAQFAPPRGTAARVEPARAPAPAAANGTAATDVRPGLVPTLSTVEAQTLDQIVRQFKRDWEEGREPRITEYLDNSPVQRGSLLVELVHADLEYRLDAGRPVRVEDYLRRFPELGDEESARLVARDYELRRRDGSEPARADYLARFPRLASRLTRRFSALDARSLEPDRNATRVSGTTPARETPAAGVALPAKFEVLTLLGEGGMGQVWKVKRPDLGIERAVKLILPRMGVEPEVLSRMLHEARIMARLNHPHAVTVHDVCTDGVPYIEMEFIPGQTLEKVIQDGPRSPEWTARILSQLCAVLQEAHDHRIIHRDLKPANLMLADGHPPGEEFLKVLDFGIAKDLDAETVRTQQGQIIGTVMYMSPEQVRSEPVGPRADLYAVGVILYELLTGCRPFTSRYPAIFHDIMTTPPPRFRERNPAVTVPKAVENLVLRCLEKDPALRPDSARALAAEFRRLTAPPEPRAQGVLRRRLLLAGLAATALGLAGNGLWHRLFPVPFTLKAEPAVLRVRSGVLDQRVSILVAPDGVAGRVEVAPTGALPEGIALEPVAGATGGAIRQFRVDVTDPNLVPPDASGPLRRTLAFVATDGRTRRPLSVELRIEPPQVVAPPPHWEPAGRLVLNRGKVYSSEIRRAVPGAGRSVVARLIPHEQAGDPAPFYMMENKVWIGLFEAFARERKLPRESRGRAPDATLLPALNIVGTDAQACAAWLGGPGRGFLPTCDQWDKAAARPRPAAGPNKEPWEPWDPRDPKQIAVSPDPANPLKQPLPIGAATRDVSPSSGCRDLYGNGWEWTRPPRDQEQSACIEVRAQGFRQNAPFKFEKLKSFPQCFPFDEPQPETGFRVVIELEPGE